MYVEKLILGLLVFCLILLLAGCKEKRNSSVTDEQDSTTEPATKTEDVFSEVVVVTEHPVAYEKVELALYEGDPKIKEGGNPFDYRYMNVVGIFKSPSGKTYKLPAFWYRDYEILFDTSYTGEPGGIWGVPSKNPNEPQGLEHVHLIGEEHYRLRFLPEEPGKWTYWILVEREGNLVQELSGQIHVAENDVIYRGFLQVEPKHRRNFIFEDGTTFIPIGQNTGWYTSTTRKTRDYDVWFRRMHENGVNFTRIWLAQPTFALHWGDSYNDFTNRMAGQARLDRVVELAHHYDIYIMLTLITHGQFSAIVNPSWEFNPWNKKNGGILDFPAQFFYKEEAKAVYKNQLLYLIGRYGYSHHIIWELWNEVDWTDGFNSNDVYFWHQEMARFIKEHDPYPHLVTTSYKYETGAAYRLEDIDYVNPHNYDYRGQNFNIMLPERLEYIWQEYKKPVLHSEIGIHWENGQLTTQADPTGITIHQASWAGMMGGGAGGAMNWWWDSWVHPNDLYYRFKGAATYAKELNMVGDVYRQLRFDESVEISDERIGILGYQIDDRLYAYLFDKNWKHTHPEVKDKMDVLVKIPFMNGQYNLRIFNTITGEVLEEKTIKVENNTFTYTFDVIGTDIAIIVE